jgi:hypothetical protein
MSERYTLDLNDELMGAPVIRRDGVFVCSFRSNTLYGQPNTEANHDDARTVLALLNEQAAQSAPPTPGELPTRESVRAELVAAVGECCGGADPLCDAECLVVRAIRQRDKLAQAGGDPPPQMTGCGCNGPNDPEPGDPCPHDSERD